MLNWIDYSILFILLFYGIEGYGLGALPALFDLIQFAASFFFGLTLYVYLVPFITRFFRFPTGIANAVSFFAVCFLSEILLHIILGSILKNVLKKSFLLESNIQTVNRLLGILPGLVSGLVLVMFVITVVAAVPTTPFLKKAINTSVIGSVVLARSQIFENQANTIFGKAATDTINFLTVEPESNESVALNFTYKNGIEDSEGESQMLSMVNEQRAQNNLPPLVADSALQNLAVSHAQDMLSRGYFSHYTPEGLSPFDRMDKAGIKYQAAGENLAFAPNVTIAMQGLMNSPGHRANILSKDFRKVGIGVIDAGIYGEMFDQEFTN